MQALEAWEAKYFDSLLPGYWIASASTAAALLVVAAPLGRFSDPKWGPQINAKFAWFTMELPTIFSLAWFLLAGDAAHIANRPNQILFALYLFHYIHRVFIYPLRTRGGKPMPVLTWFLAVVFNVVNGYWQGRYFGKYAPLYDMAHLSSAYFIVGAAMFVVGMAINIHSDSILLNLRKPGETGYKIPYGGAFSLVSAANFFGEVFEWCGYAVATGFAPPGIGFCLYTASNLVPRGLWQHRWYHDKFKGEYPQNRKAVIPFIL